MPRSGQERLVDVVWSEESAGACADPDSEELPMALSAQAVLGGFAAGEDYRLVLTGLDGRELTASQGAVDGDACVDVSFEEAPDPGEHTLTAFVGPAWERLASEATTVFLSDDDGTSDEWPDEQTEGEAVDESRP